jgi:hypothetical protein
MSLANRQIESVSKIKVTQIFQSVSQNYNIIIYISNTQVEGVRRKFVPFSDSISITDSLVFQIGYVYSDSISITDSIEIIKPSASVLSDSVNVSDSLVVSLSLTPSLSDDISVSDSLVTSYGPSQVLSDDISVSDSVNVTI